MKPAPAPLSNATKTRRRREVSTLHHLPLVCTRSSSSSSLCCVVVVAVSRGAVPWATVQERPARLFRDACRRRGTCCPWFLQPPLAHHSNGHSSRTSGEDGARHDSCHCDRKSVSGLCDADCCLQNVLAATRRNTNNTELTRRTHARTRARDINYRVETKAATATTTTATARPRL